MKTTDIHELGEVIRQERKRQGLRLEDLADENISPATISNIERGTSHVRYEKAQYLLDKLGLKLEDIPHLLLQERDKLLELQRQARMIESMIVVGNVEIARELLDHIEVDDKHPLAATFHFHRGQLHITQKNWRRAESALHHAIHLSNVVKQTSNVEAAAFQALSFVHYEQNDLETALKFIESGIAAFQSDGERKQVYFGLQRNKAIYLERLGRTAESMRVVQDIWPQLSQCTDIETKLTFYWLRAELLRRLGMFDEALDFAYIGEDLARQNKSHFSMFTFWTVLGTVYMQRNQMEQAESCFQTALSLKDKLSVSEQKSLNTAYARFAILQQQQKRIPEALELIDESIQSAKEHQDEPHLIQSLAIKGNILKAQGKDREAGEMYKKALTLSQKHQDRKREARLLFRLAECYENVDEQAFETASRDLFHAQKRLEKERSLLDEEL
ncbi:helix-turn-helix domain-containing protein [Kroppenstedtia eburnea]|uniref:helix-turn-helix domain-containing protein n=1 Tax=Kroppenstedtia eburnea TaxID=714067 RepID=UPI003631A1DF